MEVEVVDKPTASSPNQTPQNTAACVDCKEIFMQKETVSLLASKKGLQFKRSRLDMLQSALDGCPLCRELLCCDSSSKHSGTRLYARDETGLVISNELLESWRDEVIKWYSLSISALKLKGYMLIGDVGKSFYVRARPLRNYRKSEILRLKVATEPDECTAEFVCGRTASRGVNEKTYQSIRAWLSDCDTNHGCRVQQPSSLHSRPKFVVDVSPKPDAPDIVRLHIVGDKDLKYAALSYCWGQNQQSATSSFNLEAYLKEIDSAILPKSLQDAIEVTRMLQLEYLWVDSLCILQDDEAAKDCNAGFLESQKLDYQPMTLPFCTPAGTIGSVELTACHWVAGYRQKPEMELAQDAESYRSQPISTRAWTFQESFMSRRMIAYSKHKVFWVCSQSDEYYGGNQSYESYMNLMPERWRKDFRASSVAANLSVRKLKTPCPSDWYRIVEEYSWREMTDAADKLPALSSIASYFGRTLNDIYLAGLWKASFVQQLYWHNAPGAVLRQPSEWRAPSWSFMSIDGPISFNSFAILPSKYDKHRPHYADDSGMSFCAVESVAVTLVSPLAPYGQIISGNLEVWCRPIKVEELTSEKTLKGSIRYYGKVQMMGGGQKIVYLEFDTIDEGKDTSEPTSHTFFRTSRGDISTSGVLWCVTLLCNMETLGRYEPYGLVLAQLMNGNYLRIGVFYSYENYQHLQKQPRQKITIV